MKILILKRDKIGDLLLTTPMISHLRRSLPQSEIHLLANEYNAWIVDQNRDIDRLWVYGRTRMGDRVQVYAVFQQILQTLQLRKQKFDVVIAAGGEESPRAIKRAAHTGGRRTVGYCDTPSLRARLTHPLPVPKHGHEVERLLDLLVPIGIARPSAIPDPQFAVPAEARQRATDWLYQRGLGANGYVVIGLGARKAKKQPSAEQILRWSADIKDRYGLDTVFMWTPGRKDDNPLYPGDDEITEPVLARRCSYIHPCREPLLLAVGIVEQARTSIFPDSGLMHIAAASPGGVLGLFTTTAQSPAQWAPRGPKACFLEAADNVATLADTPVQGCLERLINSEAYGRKAAG